VIRVAWGCVRLGATHRFAYRLEVATAILWALIIVVLNASIWGEVSRGREQVAGMSPQEISSYVIVAWVFVTVTGCRIEELIGHRFRTGQIAMDLIRPLELQTYLVYRQIGRASANLLLTATPVLLIAAVLFPVVWPTAWWTWPVVALSLILGVLIAAHLSFLIGIFAFQLKNIAGLGQLKATLGGLMSGAVVPLDAMPGVAREVVMWLPFQAICHTPVILFLERVPVEQIWMPLGVQLAWLCVLFGLCRVMWSRALSHLTVQGG